MKKVLVASIILINLFLVGCSNAGNNNEKAEESETVNSSSQTIEIEMSENKKETTLSTTNKSTGNKSKNIDAVLSAFEQNLPDFSVKYQEKMNVFMLTPTDKRFFEEIIEILNGNDPTSWYQLRDSLANLSSKFSTAFKEPIAIAINLPDEYATEKDQMMVYVISGVVLQDSIDQLLKSKGR